MVQVLGDINIGEIAREPLKNLGGEALARRMWQKRRSLHAVNEQFFAKFNDARTNKVLFQLAARLDAGVDRLKISIPRLQQAAYLTCAVLILLVSACSSHKPAGSAHKPEVAAGPSEPPKKKGRYSLLEDQGPDVDIDVTNIPNAVPKKEERTIAGNVSPYTVLGKTYSIQFNAAKYSEIGLASWYGKKFHGERTSNGEIYNMFGMTAAHKTLPIPCYVRVTNLTNNKNVILRVNDRGPFHEDRVIDLTYTAAKKLDFHRTGTAKVRVDVINLNDFRPLSVAAVKSDGGAKLTGALAGVAAINKTPEAPKATNPSAAVNTLPAAALPPVAAKGTAASTAQAVSAPQPLSTAQLKVSSTKAAAFTPVYLQVGAFTSQAGAVVLQKKLRGYTQLPIVLMPVVDKKIVRVLVGPIADANELQTLKQTLTDKKLATPYVVQLDGK